MKQFHVETKNQKTGKWSLAHRIKCHYRLGYASWRYWPYTTICTRLVIVDQDQSEMLALGRAMQHATYLSRKRRVAGTPLVASIDSRIIQLEFLARQGEVRWKTVWESRKSEQKAKINGPHSD